MLIVHHSCVYFYLNTHQMKVFCVYSGVYISMYSDCLDLNRWYHGKSGYIAIIRLTKVIGNREMVVWRNVVIVFSFKENILLYE